MGIQQISSQKRPVSLSLGSSSPHPLCSPTHSFELMSWEARVWKLMENGAKPACTCVAHRQCNGRECTLPGPVCSTEPKQKLPILANSRIRLQLRIPCMASSTQHMKGNLHWRVFTGTSGKTDCLRIQEQVSAAQSDHWKGLPQLILPSANSNCSAWPCLLSLGAQTCLAFHPAWRASCTKQAGSQNGLPWQMEAWSQTCALIDPGAFS